jgi:hypothetical protein
MKIEAALETIDKERIKIRGVLKMNEEDSDMIDQEGTMIQEARDLVQEARIPVDGIDMKIPPVDWEMEYDMTE